MIGQQRIPTMLSSLETLKHKGVEIKSIIDVGILNGTQPLMSAFPNIKHYLFEPVEFHFDSIERNYKNLDYELYNIALSDKDSECYLIGWSVDGGNKVTHSMISDAPAKEHKGMPVILCKKIRKARLDTVVSESEIETPFLLKVDVDGQELQILHGSENSLRNSSVVVIEAPLQKNSLPQFLVRMQYMLDHNFVLMDIVDFAYYDGILWQADLIFVRKDIAENTVGLRPFESESFLFNRELWYPLTKKLFNE